MAVFGRTGIGGVILNGRRVDRPLLRIWWVASEKGPKVAILIPRRFGKASRRNRIRRRLREFVMGRLRAAAAPVCLVIKLKQDFVGEAGYIAVRSELEDVLGSILRELGKNDDPCDQRL